jgi:hypothetical protein
MELNALNVGLVLGFLLILLIILGVVIFKVCKQVPNDAVFPQHIDDLEIAQTDSSESSLKILEIDELDVRG